MKRRGFLSLLVTAPVAAPVAAKEAAAKMGLASATSAMGLVSQGLGAHGVPVPDGGPNGWVASEIKDFFSAERVEGRMIRAKEGARCLDSDLAALRSVSPAWAHNAQVSRVHARYERQELSWLRKTADSAGLGWMLPGGRS